jgi:hypothetical protein
MKEQKQGQDKTGDELGMANLLLENKMGRAMGVIAKGKISILIGC